MIFDFHVGAFPLEIFYYSILMVTGGCAMEVPTESEVPGSTIEIGGLATVIRPDCRLLPGRTTLTGGLAMVGPWQ
jgi:hypothetical protein